MKSRFPANLSTYLRFGFTGAVLTLVITQIITGWLTICGASTQSLVSVLLATAAAIVVCPKTVFQLNRFLPHQFASVCIAAALIGMSWCLTATVDRLLYFGVQLAGPFLAFVVPAIFVAALVIVLLTWANNAKAVSTAGSARAMFVGAAGGLLVSVVHGIIVAPLALSVTIVAVTATVLNCLCRCGEIADQSNVSPDSRQDALHTTCAAIAFGVSLHAVVRLLSGMMPISVGLLCVAAALCFAGCAALFTPLGTHRLARPRWLIASLIAMSSLPVLSSQLVELNLSANATVSSVILLTLIRALHVAVFWSVCFAVWRVLSGAAASQDSAAFLPAIPVVLAGIVVAMAMSATGLPARLEFAIAIMLFVGPLLLRNIRMSEGLLSRAVPTRGVCFGTVVIALPLILVSQDFASNSQLLFSSRAAHSYRLGVEADVIAQSDCARLLEKHNSSSGVITVWRKLGDLIELRRDGLPLGTVSTNTMITPQLVADSLTAVLPLVMHQNAQSVLVLGDETGVATRVCCGFPIHTIESVRTDQLLTRMAERFTWNSMAMAPRDDDRVTLRHDSIAATVRRKRGSGFDVVIAVTPHPGAHAAPLFLSSEFYAAVRTQLSDDGVFCQRIGQYDLGPQALVRMMYSASAVFGRVVMLQMAPGEIAMVAGVQPQSLLDVRLLSRLQRDHVGRQLAHSGWDWSQVAALPIVDCNNPVGIFDHTKRLPAASAANGRFMFGLPLESIRWGNKLAELKSAFAPHQQRMAEATPRSKAHDEYGRRFSSVVQQHEILTNFPDQPWAYRKSLKMEMQRNPRPATESVRNGQIVRDSHPLDQHRKDYFIALGAALGQAATGQIDPLVLRELSRFTIRYEPLLSDFAHHEVVNIHEATGHQSPALELRHRLHTVYFTSPLDFSVRIVTNAMRQVLDDPELLPNDEARFDHMNAMLQESVRRWEGRRGYDPPSAQRAQRDVDESIRMANRALDSLDRWAGHVGVTPEEMQARRSFVNNALILPLRKYRTQVLAHRIRKKQPHRSDGEGTESMPLLMDPAELMTN
ncbi:MAG: hypothetical protein GY878_26285 [Fuerstiella sp.]|nr:hypothetical protein [Fuerstiella sp.]